MDVFVSWCVDQIDGLTAAAIMADNVEELRRISADLRRSAENFKAWAMAVGGAPVLDLNTCGSVRVPADRMAELPAVVKKFDGLCEATLSVGVGMCLSESHQAMQYSQVKGGDQISLYDPKMEEAVEEARKPIPDALAGLAKNQKVGTEQPEAPVGEAEAPEPAPEPGTDQAHSPTPDAMPATAPQVQGGDIQAPAPAQDQGQGQDEQQAQQDPRAAVVQALTKIKEQAPILEQMKQSNPDAYEAVKGVVAAMIMMAQGMVTQDGPQPTQKSESGEDNLEKAYPPKPYPVVQRINAQAPGTTPQPRAPVAVKPMGADAIFKPSTVVKPTPVAVKPTPVVKPTPIVQPQQPAPVAAAPVESAPATAPALSHQDEMKRLKSEMNRAQNVARSAPTPHKRDTARAYYNQMSRDLHNLKLKMRQANAPAATPAPADDALKAELDATEEKGEQEHNYGRTRNHVSYWHRDQGQGNTRPIGEFGSAREAQDFVTEHNAKNTHPDKLPPTPKPEGWRERFGKAEMNPNLHGSVEGFMSGLKALPKGSPGRGKFVTQHMNHAPFLSALQQHPQGAQIHQMLTTHLNGQANAGFKPGSTVAMAKDDALKSELPTSEMESSEKSCIKGQRHFFGDADYCLRCSKKKSVVEGMEKAALPMPKGHQPHHEYPIGTEKDGKVKVGHIDPATNASEGTGWKSVRAGQIMSEDGHAVSSRNPSGK
jgi:hypothetical protein